MGQTNTILFFVGLLLTPIGITSFVAPNVARIISAPGNARLKSLIATTIGIIIIIISLVIEILG